MMILHNSEKNYLLIQRTFYSQPIFVYYMCIYHCCTDICVTQKILYCSDIISIFQQMCCKAMPESMDCKPFSDICFSPGLFYCFLEISPENMMSPHDLCLRIYRQRIRRKCTEPDPFFSCIWGFVFKKKKGQVNYLHIKNKMSKQGILHSTLQAGEIFEVYFSVSEEMMNW